MVLGRDLHGHHDRHGPRHACAEVVHKQQSSFLHPATLPLAPLHHNCGGVKVLLLLPEHDLDVVLVLDGPQVGAVRVLSSLETLQERLQLDKALPDYQSHLGTMGRSKLKRSGVSSLTLALARSTPAISPAML